MQGEENQQRRMLSQAGKLAALESAATVPIKKRNTSDNAETFPTDFNAEWIMESRTRAALRAACNALTGPLTAEYGPCTTGNKKIVRTQNTATTVSSAPIRPEVITVSLSIISEG